MKEGERAADRIDKRALNVYKINVIFHRAKPVMLKRHGFAHSQKSLIPKYRQIHDAEAISDMDCMWHCKMHINFLATGVFLHLHKKVNRMDTRFEIILASAYLDNPFTIQSL